MQKVIKASILSLVLGPFTTQAIENNANNIDTLQINSDRIGYWLTKRGTINSSDSAAVKQQKINDYISKFTINNQRNLKQKKNYQPSPAFMSKVLKAKMNAQRSNESSKSTAVNVLAVLIDFPDLPYNNNRLSSRDTDLFYVQYPPSHYTDLLFSETGFAGPAAQNFMSVKQYYDQESGNSFDFSGSVLGWYRAKQPAAFYGGNDGDNGNDKNAESLVVEAINAAVASGDVNLSDFDVKDPQDMDKDGNFDEPDGYIDHVLIVHSSVGEEAGGGYLGTDAIWSHRFSVPQATANITGSSVKVRNYTIVPIDSGAGVVAHEFGHDLGLDDEYDLNSTLIGSPIGSWSIMAAGSWLGEIRGTEPTVFSPLAREQLQVAFGGNWITQQIIKAEDLTDSAQDISFTQASVHSTTPNQIKIELPPHQEFFGEAKQGNYQILADHKNDSNFRYSMAVDIPDATNITLNVWAKWEIEEGYDYAQIKINGNALANTYTTQTSGNIINVHDFITGKLSGTPWTKLSFDVSQYKNTSVTLDIDYVTDPAVGGFGIAIDDISISSDDNEISVIDFEQPATFSSIENTLNFKRINAYKDAEPDNYYIQLRSNELLDKGLVSVDYEPGVLLWYRNENFSDNNSSVHPGEGFIAVIDADQNRLSTGNTEKQIRDAAFSLYPQASLTSDNHLEANDTFNDANDYSSPEQPQNGTKLPLWGIKFQVTQQASNSNTATISLSRDVITLTTEIAANRNGRTVSFSHESVSSYALTSFSWNFGDGVTSTLANPVHTYASNGAYNVTLTVSDTASATAGSEKSISVGPALNITADHTLDKFDVSLAARVEGGIAPFTYSWDFGDGNQSTLESVNHRYANVGEFEVTLIVGDAIGQQQTTAIQLTVQSDLAIDYSHSAANQVVNFTGVINTPTGATTIAWDFGDGQSSSDLSPNHVYQRSGSYVVKFTVTDESGTTKTLTKTISVFASNIADTSDESSGGMLGIMGLFMMLIVGFRRTLKSKS